MTTQKPANTKLIVTPDEFAAEMGVDRRTVDRWNRLRIGPPRVQITAKVVGYRRPSIEQWLISREQPVRGKRA